LLTCKIDLDFYRGQVAKTVNEIQIGVLRASRIAAQEGAAWAKSFGKFQDRTGNLRGNIRAKYVSGNQNGSKWSIVSPEKYSAFVEKGTKPHEIWPKAQNGFSGPTKRGQSRRADNDVGVGRGHALRWVVGGQSFFAKMVKHPGAKPHPFMMPAFFKAELVLWRELMAIEQNVRRLWSVR
jgi:hypothetical protein